MLQLDLSFRQLMEMEFNKVIHKLKEAMFNASTASEHVAEIE